MLHDLFYDYFSDNQIMFYLQADIAPTKLRLNDTYTVYYYNYSRLIFTGILPFLALIKFNYQIHHAIKIRRQNMRGNQHKKCSARECIKRCSSKLQEGNDISSHFG